MKPTIIDRMNKVVTSLQMRGLSVDSLMLGDIEFNELKNFVDHPDIQIDAPNQFNRAGIPQIYYCSYKVGYSPYSGIWIKLKEGST